MSGLPKKTGNKFEHRAFPGACAVRITQSHSSKQEVGKFIYFTNLFHNKALKKCVDLYNQIKGTRKERKKNERKEEIVAQIIK